MEKTYRVTTAEIIDETGQNVRTPEPGSIFREGEVISVAGCFDGTYVITVEIPKKTKRLYGEGSYIDVEVVTCDKCGEEVPDTEITKDIHGESYCIFCKCEHLVKCRDCEEWFPNTEGLETNDGTVCDNCADDYTTCDRCGEVIPNNDSFWFDDRSWCEACYDEKVITCSDCGRAVYRDEASVTVNDDYVCERCASENCIYCEHCRQLINCDNAVWSESHEAYYCDNCAPEEDDAEDCPEIHSYGYKPPPHFYGKGPLFMGVELEVENVSEDIRNSEAAPNLADWWRGQAYFKEDGSLSTGFEIVTHPMTLAYHCTDMAWEKGLSYLSHNGYQSHKTQSCGLHVHVNRTFFNNNADCVKLGLFVNTQKENFEALARRSANSYAKFKKILKGDKARAHKNEDSRYEALNWNNRNTIEFRLFRGTLKTDTLLATLQLVNAVCHFVKTINVVQVQELDSAWKAFCEYIDTDKKAYSMLKLYMVSKNVWTKEVK